MSNDSQKAEKAVATAEAAVASAQAIVADLESKRGDAVRWSQALADERANVALAAHTGDEAAETDEQRRARQKKESEG